MNRTYFTQLRKTRPNIHNVKNHYKLDSTQIHYQREIQQKLEKLAKNSGTSKVKEYK